MATQAPAVAGVFTRASSGLVRQVRTADVMFYGVQQIALSYIVFIVIAWGSYPGASMPLASFIATTGGVAMGICYAMFATLYPRSGGEYVYLSRTIIPVVGFMVSFSFALWETFYTGINGAFLSLYSISPFLAGLGLQTNSQTLLNAADWFTHGWGIFITGTVTIAVLAYLQYRGAGVYFRWQRWASYLALSSIALTILVLFLAWTGVLDFKSHFDALAGPGAYQKVVDQGIKTHVAPPAPFDLSQTLKFMIWPAFSIWFAVASTSFSGEVKNVQRSQLLGITGAMVLMGLAFISLTALYTGAFGGSFLLSASANGIPLKAPAYVPLFTAIAGGNIVLTTLMSLWVLLIAVFVTGTTLVYASRASLAWALDGVAPSWLGSVNEKYHSPHWALLLWAVVGVIFLALYAFTALLGPISGFLGLAISFIVVSIWAIFFPFVRKEQFENSPIAWRVGGFPLMSLLGIVATIVVGYGFYRLATDSTFSTNLTFADGGAVVGLVFAAIWFYAWKAYRRRQGVDIDRRYAQIPIE
ncbi:MAG TPA: APC family permease [Candidatus Dormibacteraeota bacterium]|nr:APC family permease [Candidatus Dormibacteraeota bacterium]